MRAIPILLYHSVSGDPSPALADYTLDPARFEEHAAVIAEQGWQTLTVGELTRRVAEGAITDEPTLAITFDDGFADTAEQAAPILDRHGLAATIYVTSGCVGQDCDWLGPQGRRPMASWQQLRDLSDLGWEIGAHSVDHSQLDVLRPAALREQIRGSRSGLQDHMGLPVESFAYPHGYHSGRVRREVIAAGFLSACAVKNSLSSTADDPYALARLTVASTLTGDDLARLLGGQNRRTRIMTGGRELTRTKVWRCYRRVRHETVRATRGLL